MRGNGFWEREQFNFLQAEDSVVLSWSFHCQPKLKRNDNKIFEGIL
jgi:hypothetical protein